MDFVNSLPDPVEGSTATNIEEAIAEAQALEAEKKTLKYKVKHLFIKDDNQKVKAKKNEITEEKEPDSSGMTEENTISEQAEAEGSEQIGE